MPNINFHKVTSLPATLDASAFYYVENGVYAESYITNNSGQVRSIGNSTMINALIDAKFSQANLIEIVADIAERDALGAASDRNLVILVTDATADPDVNLGAALYAFNNSDDTFTLLSEYESLNVTVTWSAISGRPNSTPTAIDEAVSASHSHTNKSVLDKFSEGANGLPLYEGNQIATAWSTNDF